MKTISREQRARQFMQFASLRGYYAYVREQERHREPRRELSDDQAEELSAALSGLSRGDMVRITHYSGDHYEVTEGVLTGFDPVYRRLAIVRREVRFDDIIAAEVVFRQDDIPDM